MKYRNDMTESNTRPKRTLLLALLAACAVGYLVVSDGDGELVKLARCFGTGDGFGYTTIDGSPFEVDYFGTPYGGTVDNLIDIHVHLLGAYERPVLQAMQDILELKRPAGDGVVVDVGANVGTHTFFLANHAAHVHAVEPWPTAINRMASSLERGSLDNVTIHPVGLASTPGSLPFTIPPDFNQGWGSFSSSYADDHYGAGETIELPLVVADSYFEEKNLSRVDLIKIDIEGYEKPALRGFTKYLERDHPVVFFELNVTNQEGFHSEAELRATFPSGYEFFRIRQEPEFVWRAGDHLLLCGPESGRFDLVPFPMRFDRDGWNLVAMDGELASKLDEL